MQNYYCQCKNHLYFWGQIKHSTVLTGCKWNHWHAIYLEVITRVHIYRIWLKGKREIWELALNILKWRRGKLTVSCFFTTNKYFVYKK